MKAMTPSEQQKNVRTAYVALDAVDRLVGRGLGGRDTEQALEAIRELIKKIDNAPVAERKAAR
jgi:hypothetical protein